MPESRIINGVLFTNGVPSPEEIAENEAKHGDPNSTDAKPLTCAWLVLHDNPGKREPKVSVVQVFVGPPFEEDGGEEVVWMMAPGLTTHFRAVPTCGRWPLDAWWTPLSWMRLPVRYASTPKEMATALFDGLTSEERSDVLEHLSETWCPHCGDEHSKHGGSCQCWNDE